MNLKKRINWFYLAIFSFTILLFSHYFLQKYLFMQPCEQCVYIRFAIFAIFIGSIISFLSPKLRILGYIFGQYGVILGISSSLHLMKIKNAISGDDFFGLRGCSMEPKFLLNIPFDKLCPAMFAPTGDCGYDAPVVPKDSVLTNLQSYFINLYNDGWYLIPQKQFLNIAQTSLILFIFFEIIFIFALFFEFKHNKITK